MSVYENTLEALVGNPSTWAVTGVAGFIGSNILQRLLMTGQRVVGLDNLSTGFRRNLKHVEREVGPAAWGRFRFVQGDIRDRDACGELAAGADYVVHQAALASVPRSLEHPEETHEVNVTGFLHILEAARKHGVRRVVYASSSAVYGDDAAPAKAEPSLGRTLSPYATSKRVNELYAQMFTQCYGVSTVGLRYFNIFGRRQDPNGAYAAVIPKWFATVLQGDLVQVHGDGKTTRDFCFVEDVVQANLLAATSANPGSGPGPDGGGLVCNVGTGMATSLVELFDAIREIADGRSAMPVHPKPVFGDFRPGDIRHSRADISRARQRLGYDPQYDLRRGLLEAFAWYAQSAGVAAER